MILRVGEREVVGELRGHGREREKRGKRRRREIPHPINSEEGLIDAGQIVIVRGGVRGGGRRVRMKVSIIHLFLVLCTNATTFPSPLLPSPLLLQQMWVR